MSNELIYFFSVLVQNLIIVIYVSTVFEYKYNKNITNIFIFLILTILYLSTLWIGNDRFLKFIILVSVQVLLYKIVSTNTWKETLKKYIVIFFLTMISKIVSDVVYLITAYLTNTKININNIVNYDNLRVVNIILSLPMYMTTILIYSVFYKKIKGIIRRKLLILLMLIPIAVYPLNYVLYSYNIERFSQTTIFFILLCIFAFTLLTHTIYKLITNIEKLVNEEKELEYLKEKKYLEYEYFSLIKAKEEEIKKINHDIKNNLQVVSTIKKESDRNNYINKIVEELDDNKIINYSNNEILNIVLNLKENEAKEKNLKIKYKIENDLDFIKECDLSNLLTNILDNAIESSSGNISLMIYKKLDYYVIKEINSCNKKVDITTSTKGNNHGYGLKIIREIVKKYNGDIEININNKEYELIIMIKEV